MNTATQSKLTQEEINKAVAAGLARGKTHATIAAELGIARRSNPMIVAFRLAEGHADLPAAQRGRARNWNGKTNPTRERELKGRKKTEPEKFLFLVKVQLLVSQLSSVLEGVKVEDIDFGDEVSMWHVIDMYDDLTSLGIWMDRTLFALQGKMDDAAIEAKLKQLRDVSGRSPEEADNFLRYADKLERIYRKRLAGSGRA